MLWFLLESTGARKLFHGIVNRTLSLKSQRMSDTLSDSVWREKKIHRLTPYVSRAPNDPNAVTNADFL